MCVLPPVSELLILITLVPGQGLSDLLSCGLCKVQQDHMKASE